MVTMSLAGKSPMVSRISHVASAAMAGPADVEVMASKEMAMSKKPPTVGTGRSGTANQWLRF